MRAAGGTLSTVDASGPPPPGPEEVRLRERLESNDPKHKHLGLGSRGEEPLSGTLLEPRAVRTRPLLIIYAVMIVGLVAFFVYLASSN